METSNKECPACGSTDIEVSQHPQSVGVPFGPSLSYQATIDHCRVCNVSGDFSSVNEEKIQSLIRQSTETSISAMTDGLAKNEISMSYIERAANLPCRTIASWKNGHYSAAAIFALRVIFALPWVLEIADAHFDLDYIRRRVAQEGLKSISKLAAESQLEQKMFHSREQFILTWSKPINVIIPINTIPVSELKTEKAMTSVVS